MHNISVGGWLLILGILVWVLGRILSRKKVPSAKKQAVLTGHVAETRRLTGACFGNRATADRLIEYEKKREPGITHAQAVNRALDRLKIDRGRHSV